jgi:hypothetical protein
MKRILFIFFIAALAAGSTFPQSSNTKAQTVVSAVAPEFPPLVAVANFSGDAIVEVEVNEEGKVLAARAINTPPFLRKASENAARRWRFAPHSEEKRVVQLTFTYRTMPLKTAAEDLASIFTFPYRVEVRRMRPEPITQQDPGITIPPHRKKKVRSNMAGSGSLTTHSTGARRALLLCARLAANQVACAPG